MGDLFLGFDSSTQSLTATMIDFSERKVIYQNSIGFDEAFKAKYGVTNGVLPNKNPLIVHAPPLMWAEALDKMFATMKAHGIDFSRIKAISGSGQQHGSVYLNEKFHSYLEKMKDSDSIVANAENIFTRKTSPIWMDTSTEKECEEIRRSLGGMQTTVEITGSDAFARFTGPQIRKFFKEERVAYEETAIIHLVSSFLSSILAGVSSPIDRGDGAGMNLMDIKSGKWSKKAFEATAENLSSKMPDVKPCDTIVGDINPYFAKKYGFISDTKCVIWSGDNPNSLIGVGLIREGQAAFSLGTSDVYYAYMKDPKFSDKGEGHVFGAPTGDYMTLLVYLNGSLSREKVRNAYGLSWDEFSNILAKTEPGNGGRIMLPYFSPEITPVITRPKVMRYGFGEKDVEANVRGIIEAQMLSSRLHSEWMGVETNTIYATGGASKNREILHVMSNVHNARVYTFAVSNSASLGAALRAAEAYYKQSRPLSWESVIDGFVHIDMKNVIQPDAKAVKVYDAMLSQYAEKEKAFLASN